MSLSYDLIVTGMAGVAAVNKCAAQGWQVAIVDTLPNGGTCDLRGCDSKRRYCAAVPRSSTVFA